MKAWRRLGARNNEELRHAGLDPVSITTPLGVQAKALRAFGQTLCHPLQWFARSDVSARVGRAGAAMTEG